MRHAILIALSSCAIAGVAIAEPLAVGTPASEAPTADPAADIGIEGCGSHASVAGWLARNFTETPLVRGLQGDGQLFELYMAKQGATWTVVVTDPAGQSCIVTEGNSMEVLPHGVKGPMV